MAVNGLIALVESGATKSDWRILDAAGNTVRQFVRPGMNVSTMHIEEVERIISDSFSEEGLVAKGFYMYTAGVVTDAIRRELVAHVGTISEVQYIDIQDDLTGAARAVCGRNPGIAAILGTGSNACFFDGVNVHRNVYSGGFILGDEGSGARLGKLFLSDFIKGLVPADVVDAFAAEYDSSYAAIVEGVYRSSSPSGYLGSLAPFMLKHRDNPYIAGLIQGNFQDFVDRMLRKYDTAAYPVGLAGGFAWACRDILFPLLEQNGIRVSCILKAPVEGLIKYHCK